MSAPFHTMTARRIAEGVRGKQWTATEVAEHFLRRIAAHDEALHAYLWTDPQLTLAHARRIDEAIAAGPDPGPLAGVPFAVKDNLCLRGLPTTCASKILEGWRPPYDADPVARLLAAGAVPLGKTNLDEFAMGSSTENSAFGPTRNPWNPQCVPGGSSGGSAAAVAAGLAAFALGSDTGGSIRQPAALCGIVGAMGTYGRVSRRGLVAFGSSLDRVGPLAKTVEDAALVLATMSGGDEGDATSLHQAAPEWLEAVLTDAACDSPRAPIISRGGGLDDRPLQIGWLHELGTGLELWTEPEVIEVLIDRGYQTCRDMTRDVAEVSLPHAGDGVAVYYLVAPSEASSNLARYDGVRYGPRAPSEDLATMLAETRERGFGPEVKRRILLGTFALSAGYAEAFYEKALRARRLIADDYARLFSGPRAFDAVVSPTSPFVAFPIGAKSADPLAMYACDYFTIPASLAGLPAISVPIGLTRSGLPVGLQVVAPAGREDLMFRVAAAVERQIGPADLPKAFA